MEYTQALELRGDYEKYKILLKRRLQESGWCDQIRLQAKEIVKEKGSMSVDQLVEELLPQGRASVPSAIKKELLLKVKEGLMKTAGIEDENFGTNNPNS
ncbi:enhancer of yellow 2 transcription factor-like [Homalodisca vitripennis]|uniref:enhancer of yellow 2 transcription factor-like n=1 Tax=Homalodisca vitripennis TaxID=197043 RepID=UPI001EE9F722|nr:enhancer of yellow 2 transcription factor-like [Homalodisca vitripennis]